MFGLGYQELLLILVIVLILFGAQRLPDLARSLGGSIKEFKKGVAEVKGYTFTGFLAWWMGRSYHLLMIPGLARKARVVTDWTIGLLFPRDIAQLGALGKPTPLP